MKQTTKSIKEAKLALKQRLLEHSKGLEAGSDELKTTIDQLAKLDKVEAGQISKETYFKVAGGIVAGLAPVAVKYYLSKKG